VFHTEVMDKNLFAVREEFVFCIIYLEFTRFPHVCVCCVKYGKEHLKYSNYQCYAWNNLAYVVDIFRFPAEVNDVSLLCNV